MPTQERTYPKSNPFNPNGDGLDQLFYALFEHGCRLRVELHDRTLGGFLANNCQYDLRVLQEALASGRSVQLTSPQTRAPYLFRIDERTPYSEEFHATLVGIGVGCTQDLPLEHQARVTIGRSNYSFAVLPGWR